MKALLRHSAVRILGALGALAIAALIVWLSVIPAAETPAPQWSDKLKHFIAYAALTAPLAVALGPGLNRLCAALVLTGLYGAGLEVAQMVGDAGREGSLLDIAANLSGALAGLIVVAMLRGDRPLFRGDNF